MRTCELRAVPGLAGALKCDRCGATLERCEGAYYCPDCTRYEPAGFRRAVRAVLAAAGAAVLWALACTLGFGADLAITAASVAKASSATVVVGTAGATITAGQGLYVFTDGTLKTSLSSGTAAQATFAGVALHGSLAGQPIAYQTGGSITIGATVTVGTIYVVSASAGGIAPWADLVSGNQVTIVGYGLSATQIQLLPTVTGVAKP